MKNIFNSKKAAHQARPRVTAGETLPQLPQMNSGLVKTCAGHQFQKIAKSFVVLLILILPITGCKKLVEIPPPPTSIVGSSAYASDATAAAILTGMYANISSTSPVASGGIPSVSLFTGLSSDELTLWSGNVDPASNAYYQNLLSGNKGGYGSEFWVGLYPYIFSCNAAIEGLNSSTTLTPAVKQQLLGEAKFMRAFFYFYLTNLYGDVPMPLTSDYEVNQLLHRTPYKQVLQQIITDLTEAQSLLSATYLDATLLNPSPERVRPTKWAAAALLARVYLYNGSLTGDASNYANAEIQADSLINNTTQFGLSSLPNAFLKASLGNNEAIWQLQPVNIGWNTEDAKAFIIPQTGLGTYPSFGVYLSNNLLNSFEPGDARKAEWIDSTTVGAATYYYPFKYRINTQNSPVNEYSMMLRLGELYLIRAEARAEQGNLSGALDDLNAIRARAGLGNSTASSQSDIINAILHERQVELFTELGQRWLDLKRTGTVDAIMSVVTPQKGGAWQTFQKLYPVPYYDIQQDRNLTQNPGY